MAKVTFTKLGLKLNKDIKEFQLVDEGPIIEVKQYLPIVEKINFIEYVAANAIDEMTGCSSPVRMDVYFSLGLIKHYTNITFTDKQLEDAGKTYDLLDGNGILQIVIAHIPKEEYMFIKDVVEKTVEDIAKYNTSFAGMIKGISSDAGSMDTQFTEIFEKIKNAEGLEQLAVIKDIVG